MNNLPYFFKHKILLASQSPRRQQILKYSGFDLEIIKIDVEEDFPSNLQAEEIPLFLAQKKAEAYQLPIQETEILVTADTVVWLNNQVLNKPQDIEEAQKMLQQLSGQKHTVYTGVCIKTSQSQHVFFDQSDVYFNILNEATINYYLEHYKPLDKAGAYGVQEFIGYVSIRRIEGCYYNIMGFPVAKFIEEIKKIV
ncbi:MAG: Maf family nucleotide pyrophosphatase [Bacteroidota bacterium]|nr:Maf family nucleotide pyrophosphatase [Bacteroidota bacterium]